LAKFKTVIRRIQELGFTSYEALAYVSLLERNPVTRYELSKNSGVPRSAIYSVIHKLEEVGAVSIYSSEPEKYAPLPPEQLFDLLNRQFNTKIEKAKEDLKDFEFQLIPDHLWNIVGYENMILKARELIQKSKKTIYLSVWQREYEALKKDIEKAEKRGVDITIYSFTDLDQKGQAKYYIYGLDENELEKFWAHKIILIMDKAELLMGEADKLHKKKTVWTTNRALIDIAMNHMILDITIYGIRMNKNVNHDVSVMQNGETDYLDRLLHEKYPEIAF
jgi:sugar-specific transcriptional regulator TrmB